MSDFLGTRPIDRKNAGDPWANQEYEAIVAKRDRGERLNIKELGFLAGRSLKSVLPSPGGGEQARQRLNPENQGFAASDVEVAARQREERADAMVSEAYATSVETQDMQNLDFFQTFAGEYANYSPDKKMELLKAINSGALPKGRPDPANTFNDLGSMDAMIAGLAERGGAFYGHQTSAIRKYLQEFSTPPATIAEAREMDPRGDVNRGTMGD